MQAWVWVSNYTPYIDVDRITYPCNSLQTQQVHHPHCYTCTSNPAGTSSPLLHMQAWVWVSNYTPYIDVDRITYPCNSLQTQQVHHPHCYTCTSNPAGTSPPLLHMQAWVWVSNYTPYIDVDRITYPCNSLQTQQVHHPHCYTCKLGCGWVITHHTLMWIGLLIPATHFKPSRYITPHCYTCTSNPAGTSPRTVTHALQTQQVHHPPLLHMHFKPSRYITPHCYTCRLQVNCRLDAMFRKIPLANSDEFHWGSHW